MRNILKWVVLNYNVNKNAIEEYNVLAHRTLHIKALKKKAKNRDEFSKLLDREMMSQYWSRSEYEMILERDNNRLYLKPWIGCRNAEEVKIEVTGDEFWEAFATSIHINWWGNEAKIDIYDQLNARWDEFVDYCWNTHLPYERKRKD